MAIPGSLHKPAEPALPGMRHMYVTVSVHGVCRFIGLCACVHRACVCISLVSCPHPLHNMALLDACIYMYANREICRDLFV